MVVFAPRCGCGEAEARVAVVKAQCRKLNIIIAKAKQHRITSGNCTPPEGD